MSRKITLEVQLTDKLSIEALELEALKHGENPAAFATRIITRFLSGLPMVVARDPMDEKVARLAADRYADNDIAVLLGISPSTVARKRGAQGIPKNYRGHVDTRVITSTLGRDTP